MSISQGIFLEPLKIVRIIPIFKDENEQLIHDYRPISVLPFLSKSLGKIFATHIPEFLEDHHVFYQYQFGYRNNHSTSNAIITLVEKVS